MVAPVTGPFSKVSGDNALSTEYRSQSIYKQAKPIDRPLNYNWSNAKAIIKNGTSLTQTRFVPSIPANLATALYTHCENKAYDKLKDQVSSQSQMGTALAELGQSTSMIANRLVQLTKVVNAVRKGDFKGVVDNLNIDRKKRDVSPVPRKISRSLANHWLEFAFGWSPLIGDIYNAVDVLQTPIRTLRPSGGSSTRLFSKSESGSKPNWTSQGYHLEIYEGKAAVKMGCEVSISNPNLFLANNLGLTNPASIAWELVPFSFVVDWFVNVGQVIGSMTDFMGLSVTNAYTTRMNRGILFEQDWNPFNVPAQAEQYVSWCSGGRTPGLTGPSLKVRAFAIPSWRRMANAASVFTQVLLKDRSRVKPLPNSLS